MMRLVTHTVGIVAGLLLVVALTTSAQQSSVKIEIAALIDQWADARVKGDAAFLEQFYAAGLRIGQMNGGVVDRKDDIALFAARRIKPEYIRDTDVSVTVYGETAVVSCIESLKGTYNGQPGEMTLRMLNVLVRRDGRWQLVASQSALISTPAAQK
jgi:ketosteroid isomerase-like protein